jgi:hypothetical protein
MNKKFLELLIERIKLQLIILKIQLEIALLKKKKTVPNLPEPKFVVVHHGGGDWNFEQVNRHHTNKWGFISSLGYGIGYQKFIEFSGKLYIGRRDNEEGAHTVEPGNPGFWNKNSVGIAVQGNTEIKDLTNGQKATLKEQLDYYKSKGYTIKMHKEISATLCPGKYLAQWIEQYRS